MTACPMVCRWPIWLRRRACRAAPSSIALRRPWEHPPAQYLAKSRACCWPKSFRGAAEIHQPGSWPLLGHDVEAGLQPRLQARVRCAPGALEGPAGGGVTRAPRKAARRQRLMAACDSVGHRAEDLHAVARGRRHDPLEVGLGRLAAGCRRAAGALISRTNSAKSLSPVIMSSRAGPDLEYRGSRAGTPRGPKA